MRGWLERIGRAFIALGAVVLLFAGYQVWGTDWVNAREQRALKTEIRERFADSERSDSERARSVPETPPADDREAPPKPDLIEPPPLGEAVGLIEIPSIGVEHVVVEGVGRDELQKGPGHYPHSPLPGRSGNVSVAGHRTTYGAPFGDLDVLENGDEITVTTDDGRFTYIVTDQLIVEPSDVSVIEPTDDARLTLTTCNPKYSARERLIVVAHLDGEPVNAAVGAGDDRGDGGEGEVPRSAPIELPSEDVSVATLDGHSDSGLSAIDQGTILWTLTLAAIGVGWWLLVRTRPRWYSRFGGALPFLLALFFFFGEVESLLPANF